MCEEIEKLAPCLGSASRRLVFVAMGVAITFGTAGCGTTRFSAGNDNAPPSSPRPALVAANDNAAPTIPLATSYFPTSVVETAVADRVSLRDYLVCGKNASHVDGLEPGFATSLRAMFVAMPQELRSKTKILSGYRSIEHQRRLFKQAVLKYGSEQKARRWVAPPGRSMHQRGLAVDLQYGSHEALAWAHANASRFGLHFPMPWEDWHIEPVDARNHS
ncbi:hypothetical protein ACVINZ_004543 [Mesorhizobium jarvisii]